MVIRSTIDSWLKRFERDFVTHNRIEISRSALIRNLRQFQSTGMAVIPVLKGNAYGHGIEQVATALSSESLPYIAVDGYFEALRIRSVSKQPVLVMGAILPQNFAHMKFNAFAFVVSDAATINALGKTGRSINLHLECNTGMNRYGAKLNQLSDLVSLIKSYDNLTLEGIMTHLADSDGTDPATIDTAVDQFDACVDQIQAMGVHPNIIHVAQSAGSVRAKSKYANTIRIGIGLYGINPFPSQHIAHQQLKNLTPALKLVSTITNVIELKQGEKVSYNYTFTAPANMPIGVLPIGYYEGVNRELSNKGVVKIGAKFAPIIGRICMNHTMISLEGISAKVGDEVVVYSNNPDDDNSVDSIANNHNLFNYNLLTALSPDVRRVLVD